MTNTCASLFLCCCFIALYAGCMPQYSVQVCVLPGPYFAPGDAIYKFNQLRAPILHKEIMRISNDKKLNINEKELSAWINGRIFSNRHSNQFIVEWNIDDPDFCHIRQTYTQYANRLDTINIKICNSVMNDDVSPGNYWVLESGETTIKIHYCSKILKTFGIVSYYQITDLGHKLDYSLQSEMLKHRVVTDVYIEYRSENNCLIEKVYTDQAYLYSGLMAIDSSHYYHH